jgi:8-oxo-dGTP diphosphatase
MQDLIAELTGGRLNIRVAAIIRNQDNILVSKWPDGTMSLVGGRVAYRGVDASSGWS